MMNNLLRKVLLLVIIVCNILYVAAQEVNVYPLHWWTDMHNPKLQLLLRGENIGKNTIATVNWPGVELKEIHHFENPGYLAIDLLIGDNTKPGKFSIRLGETVIPYELKERNSGNGTTRNLGITSEDFIYLIMPDRFSNGDPSNDRVPGMRDQSLNRDTIFERHGGDLKGIQNKLSYLQDLGVTAIWLNPVIENDMPSRTEHGYAFTDHYRIERRIGGEQAYHNLIEEIHSRGMKIIQDAVYNHTGIEHFLFRDQPDSTWFHRWPSYTQTSYKEQTLFDPYAAPSDAQRMSDGWFVTAMPDVNQQNPFFANYLIQHAIWTTEEYGIDGWRIDTYPYNDLEFMNRCNQALLNEFPKLYMFGETWVHGVINQAYFGRNTMDIDFKSNLPGLTDFQTSLYGILPALKEPFGWTNGVNSLYSTLARDIIYEDPMKNVIFLDNHDKTRFFSEIGEDFDKYKMGIAWLLTCRGIPQLYYGTEVLMKGISNPDGWVRLDFPGGWPGDAENKFEASGRNAREQEAFEYVQTLARFRLGSTAIKTGKLMQYTPDDGVYVYFRYDDAQTVMCIMNQNDGEKTIDLSRFTERITGFSQAVDVVTGKDFTLGNKMNIPGKTLLVLELK